MATEPGDAFTPWLIDAAGARGAHACLRAAYAEVLARHEYPPLLQRLLGELLAASLLLAGSLKFNGSLVLQLQGDGLLRLLVVECDRALGLRAMAQWQGEVPAAADLRDLAGRARFVITLDPKDGGELHQGIVPLEAGSVAELLEHYLERSEQIASRFWLTAKDGVAAGLMLQRLPETPAGDADGWNRVSLLAQTVTAEELRTLTVRSLLSRLFAEEDVRLFSSRAAHFHCPCTRTRVAGALRLLGREEVDDLVRERGEVEATCEFCNKRYRFDAEDVAALFADTVSETRH
jgi:molecular chaperone Hsp33